MSTALQSELEAYGVGSDIPPTSPAPGLAIRAGAGRGSAPLAKPERRLAQLRSHDQLTGLFNRHRFQKDLATLLERARLQHQQLSLICIDLDDFHWINQQYGYPVGDHILVRVVQRIVARTANMGILYRLDGNEFALLMPGSAVEQCKSTAQALQASIALPLSAGNTHCVRLTASVGVAIADADGGDATTLQLNGERALQRAKRAGKNCVRLFHPEQPKDETILQHRHVWEHRIRHALACDLLQIYFQGIYHATDRSLSHLEVLVRMRDEHNERKLFMPGEFIQIAEQSELIIAVDRWMIQASIKMLSQQPELPPLSINISGRSFDDASLPAYITSTLREHGVAANRVYLEVTETAAISDLDNAHGFIAPLREAGCRVCLDDFGVGYASMSYLGQLQIDVLKIDGAFVRGLPRNARNQILIKSMIAMARALGQTTVAEFVEDEEALILLTELGVDLAQGYHLDKPRPALGWRPQANAPAAACIPNHPSLQ